VAFGPSEFLETLIERRQKRLNFGISFAERDYHTDETSLTARLLSARNQRPRRHCTTDDINCVEQRPG